jgi:hypothetical protein
VRGKIALAFMGGLSVIALLVIWPRAVDNQSQHPVHSELFGHLFEGKKISEGKDPNRELVSRKIYTTLEEVEHFEDCAGITNLAVGTITLGSSSYSYLKGCCLLEGKDLIIHMGKLSKLHLIFTQLIPNDLAFYSSSSKEPFPTTHIEMTLGDSTVDVQSCETTPHNMSDSKKGLALSCQSSEGHLKIKLRCEDFKTLDSSSYF